MYDEYYERYVAGAGSGNTEFKDRLARLRKQTQGTEPFDFDSVMEHIYTPSKGQMFVDHCIIAYDSKLWLFLC